MFRVRQLVHAAFSLDESVMKFDFHERKHLAIRALMNAHHGATATRKRNVD